jgi:polyferredoxin
MIRNSLYGLTLIGTVYTESFYWMALPVVVLSATLVCGPIFCGWICPTGTIQEALAVPREYLFKWIKSRSGTHRLRPSAATIGLIGLFFTGFLTLVFWLGSTKRFYVEDSSLYWAASLILLCFLVISGAANDAAIRGLRALSFAIILASALMKTAIVSPVHFAFADVRDPASALTTLVLAVASIFLTRAWCRYVCPFGYLLGCLHRVSRLRVQATHDCQACGSCAQACRVGAVRNGQVRTDQCQFCLACVDRCPHGALEVVDAWKTGRGR